MSLAKSKAIAYKYFKAYETGDIDVVMEFIAPSYVLYPGGDGKPMNSVERKSDETVFFSAFSNIQVGIEDQIAEGDKVANQVIMHCTHTAEYQSIPATGKRVVIPYLDILQMEAGKSLLNGLNLTWQASLGKSVSTKTNINRPPKCVMFD